MTFLAMGIWVTLIIVAITVVSDVLEKLFGHNRRK